MFYVTRKIYTMYIKNTRTVYIKLLYDNCSNNFVSYSISQLIALFQRPSLRRLGKSDDTREPHTCSQETASRELDVG